MNLEITVKAFYKDTSSLFDVNIGSEDSIKDQVLEELENDNVDIELDDISVEVEDWQELTDYENLQDFDTLEELADYNGNYELDVINAGVECGVSINDIDEAYQGEYKDDEDFAFETADNLGEISRDNHWPHYCIDWEWAARELMMDYSEHNGHYFRNL